MNTTGEKAFGSKIFTILKMGVFKSCSNSKVKKKKKKQTKTQTTLERDSHTGLEELMQVMRTISPTSKTVRTSVPDEPELIVQDDAGSACRKLHLWLLLAEGKAAFLHLELLCTDH